MEGNESESSELAAHMETTSVPSRSVDAIEATTARDVGTSAKSDKESSISTKSGGHSEAMRDKSESRDSVNEDPRCSFVDSISATSGRPNWCSSSKDMADDDPSISSIKGDSISATIADYNRKHCNSRHRAASSDDQSRASCRQESHLSTKNVDSSVHINYYAASCSSAAGTSSQQSAPSQSRSSWHNIQNSHHQHHPHSHNSREHTQQQQRQHRGRKCSRHKRSNQVHQHTRNSSGTSRRSSLLEQALDFYDLPQGTVYQVEPIVIRGNGNMTLFGLSNSFNPEFPPALLGRVSREEFDRTMSHINGVLRSQQSLSAKLLLFGSLFCCCSLGLSLVWPSIVLKRRSRANLEKFLANENQRLYSKLGLNWKLGQRSFNRFVEHVLIIEFNPKIDAYVPD